MAACTTSSPRPASALTWPSRPSCGSTWTGPRGTACHRALVDPAFHSCGSVHGWRELAHESEPGFFVVGMKSYGRAPTFLITTGNEQVRSIAAHLAGDAAAADEVQLVLPETGVLLQQRPVRRGDRGQGSGRRGLLWEHSRRGAGAG